MNTIQSLKLNLNSILKVRSDIGANLHQVFLVTRTWSGTEIGEGMVSESFTEILPSPGIKNFSHKLIIGEAGIIKQGDLIITQISKQTFPNESDVDCLSEINAIEKMYKIGDHYYRVISVVENQLTWDVQVRRLSDQTVRI